MEIPIAFRGSDAKKRRATARLPKKRPAMQEGAGISEHEVELAFVAGGLLNDMLNKHVETKDGKAMFELDRDPVTFGFVVQYLQGGN